jgi:RimJ/RimL family protein N-acetyltransferase
MKPYAIGRSVFLREISLADAAFVLALRTDGRKSRHLSPTRADLGAQEEYIQRYLRKSDEYYFVVSDFAGRPVGTVRIYDLKRDSFCWGSWIISEGAPRNAAIESALLIYDFAFFSLHFPKAHFDVRKANDEVLAFHRRFGSKQVAEDDLNIYFEFDRDAYTNTRRRYERFLP